MKAILLSLLLGLSSVVSAEEMITIHQLEDKGQWVCNNTECGLQTYYDGKKITFWIPKAVELKILVNHQDYLDQVNVLPD